MNKSGGTENRICKRCLIRDLAIEDQKDLQKYLDVIKEPERVDKVTYEARLAICLSCEKMSGATCTACGCYVEFRDAPETFQVPCKEMV